MSIRNTLLLALSLSGAMLAASGCTGPPESPSAAVTSHPARAALSPTAAVAQAELVEALQRSQRVAHRYTVQGDLPEGERVKGSGVFDPVARKISSTIEVAGGKSPSAHQRIVIGNDNYQREVGDKVWIHLDLKRVKPGSLFHFDMADPTGLVAFSSKIGSVKQSSPGVYEGFFSPTQDGMKPFLPVGAPSIISFGMVRAAFKATIDNQGWVTSITVELTAREGPKLTMTTSMSGHGKPHQIKAPAKAITREADDIYYNS
ncbi:hypothetical protein GCM10027280_16220 [Micromonospora polyrhachis]|uniref:Lipoprotein LprG n=1 Tax=Micromonospora polyrhachis TaxID=1282883 RepID=A0A7W7WP38_9ACTN|nr:hypothetical protein [Micromonospora polyrhachis]MBB4958490.1 hypothetical protein [Micromonospora polyrhachis]